MRESARTEISRILRRAEDRLWADFEDAGVHLHRGLIGTGREDAVAKFLSARLPSRFAVASGEVIDVSGSRSGQIDLLVYDSSLTAPLLAENGRVLLPAEALLAAIEIKSRLTKEETRLAVRGFRKVRLFRPWGADWGVARRNGDTADDGFPRFFSSIFAFDTNLRTENWGESELSRLRGECEAEKVPNQHIDRVAVLSRGMILPATGMVVSMAENRKVLGAWYFNLLNFLAREANRRRAFPWSDYEPAEGQSWEQVLPAVYDAPEPKRYSQNSVKRYRRGRTNSDKL